jgi:hypothetical protein
MGGQLPRTNDDGFDDLYIGRDPGGDGLVRVGGNAEVYFNWDNSSLRVGAGDGTGRFEVSGSDATIQVGWSYEVLSNTSSTAFEIDAGGVTPIQVGTREQSGSGAGRVTLAGALDISLLAVPPTTQDIILIDFDDPTSPANAVDGTFAGLSEGASVQAKLAYNTYFWDITYQGGDGNDVALQFNRMEIPEPASFFLLGFGALALFRRRRR